MLRAVFPDQLWPVTPHTCFSIPWTHCTYTHLLALDQYSHGRVDFPTIRFFFHWGMNTVPLSKHTSVPVWVFRHGLTGTLFLSTGTKKPTTATLDDSMFSHGDPVDGLTLPQRSSRMGIELTVSSESLGEAHRLLYTGVSGEQKSTFA